MLVAELPDNVAAAGLALAFGAGGSLKAVKTTPLLTGAESRGGDEEGGPDRLQAAEVRTVHSYTQGSSFAAVSEQVPGHRSGEAGAVVQRARRAGRFAVGEGDWARAFEPDVPRRGAAPDGPSRCDPAWVVRRPPLSHVQPTAHDMSREFRVISALANTKVPVPKTYALCDDTDDHRRAVLRDGVRRGHRAGRPGRGGAAVRRERSGARWAKS